MKLIFRLAGLFCISLFALISLPAIGGDWKMASGLMETRWAKDVSPTNALPEYPRPQLVRSDWQNLNGLWNYAIFEKNAAAPETYDGNILVPYPVESALSGVMKRVGGNNRLWYRRSFSLSEAFNDKHTLLHFGAVDWDTTVTVNGKEVGKHQGGYDPFTFDITAALKPDGEQEIIVSVWNPVDNGLQPRGKQVNNPGGVYYTPVTGIWQTVWLEPVAATHIKSILVTPDIDKQEIKIHTEVDGPVSQGVVVVAHVLLSGKEVATRAGAHTTDIVIPMTDAKLWTPETPTLYELKLSLESGPAGKANEVSDKIDSYFAMRKISVGKDDKGVVRMMLNNKPVFLMGVLDQGFWPDGIYTAPTDAALKYDINVTKRLGFNMTRKHVKVEPDRWYYWCDKLGLMVWQDMPSGDEQQGNARDKREIQKDPDAAVQFEAELKSMIDHLRNHPCIIQWVIFNEGWGQYDTARLANWVKEYDPTRLVDPTSGGKDIPVGDVHDMHQYPGPDMFPADDARASVLGEFGGLALAVDGHLWEMKDSGYQVLAGDAPFTRKYINFSRKLAEFSEKGLCAAIYTQLTDVESENNGLMTYDRELIKPDLK